MKGGVFWTKEYMVFSNDLWVLNNLEIQDIPVTIFWQKHLQIKARKRFRSRENFQIVPPSWKKFQASIHKPEKMRQSCY